MRLFKREDEGGVTVADWDDGFIGLSRNESRKRLLDFQFERWACCPGSLEFKIELLGFMLVLYMEGGPCQLELFLDEEEGAVFEPAPPVQLSMPPNGSDWHSVPSPAGR